MLSDVKVRKVGDSPLEGFELVNRKYLQQNGTSTNRPTVKLAVGQMYFDTTLGTPIWYNGSGWVDSAGASV